MTRTASMGSRVPPAVTSTRTPARSWLRAKTQSAASTMRVRIGEAAFAHVAAREPTGLRVDHVHAATAQGGQVLLHRGVLPHLGVHRRSDQHRGPGGEQRGGEQVVGDPGRVLPEQLGSGGRDHDQVGRLAEMGVRDHLSRGVRATREQRRARRFGGEGRKRELTDEAQCVSGEHRHHVGAGIDEAPADVDGLVRGDASRHAEHDPSTLQRAHRVIVGRVACVRRSTARNRGSRPPRSCHPRRPARAPAAAARPRSCRPRSPRVRSTGACATRR